MRVDQVNDVVFSGTQATADLVADYINSNIPTGESLPALQRTSHGILVAYKSALIWNTGFEPVRYDPKWEQARPMIIHLQEKTAYSRDQIENFLYALQSLAASGAIDLGDYDPLGVLESEQAVEDYEREREGTDNGNGGGNGLVYLMIGGALLALVVFRRRKHR